MLWFVVLLLLLLLFCVGVRCLRLFVYCYLLWLVGSSLFGFRSVCGYLDWYLLLMFNSVVIRIFIIWI